MLTKMEPATGLYESMAYVEAIAGRAATWMPVQVHPTITITCTLTISVFRQIRCTLELAMRDGKTLTFQFS